MLIHTPDTWPRRLGSCYRDGTRCAIRWPEHATARRTHPAQFADVPPAADLHPWKNFISYLEAQWLARVERIERLSPTIIEVVVRAPMQARIFEPGHFYRLQNYEANAKSFEGYTLTMENLALTGAWVDKEQGLLSMIALEMGVSSRLCAKLDVGELVVVMGPTGAATDIPEGENVILCGGGLGNAVLFSNR